MSLLPPSPKTLIVIDGRKGGVGKSTVAAAVYEYLHQQGTAETRLYDLDGQHGDLSLRYSAATVPLRARKLDDYGQIIDDLMDPGGTISTAVVDVGAPAGPLLDRFLIEAGPQQALENGLLTVIVLWVVGATPRSMQHLADARATWLDAGLEIYPAAPASARISVIIVANEGQGSNFGFIKQAASGADLPVIVFPRLEEEAAQEVVALGAGFLDYTRLPRHAHPKPSFSRQVIVDRWLANTRRAFDMVPQLSSLTLPSQPAEPERLQNQSPEPAMAARVTGAPPVDADPGPHHLTHSPLASEAPAHIVRHALPAAVSDDTDRTPSTRRDANTAHTAQDEVRPAGVSQEDAQPQPKTASPAASPIPAIPVAARGAAESGPTLPPPTQPYPGVPAAPAHTPRAPVSSGMAPHSTQALPWPRHWPLSTTIGG